MSITWTPEDEAADAEVERRRDRYQELLAEQSTRDPFEGLPGLENVALPGMEA